MIADFIKEVKTFFKSVYQTDLTKEPLEELEKQNNKMLSFYADPIVCKRDTEEDKIYSVIAITVLDYYSYFVRKSEYADEAMEFISNLLASIPEGAAKTKQVALEYWNDFKPLMVKYTKRIMEVNPYLEDLILHGDLDSYNYLYYYGSNITENYKKTVDFFNNSVNDETLNDMARCTIEAFYRGLKSNGIDISKKKYFVLDYPIGFEKVVRKIYEIVDGKYEIVLRPEDNDFNKQVNYNHRYDYNMYETEEYIEGYLKAFKEELLKRQDRISEFLGPIYIESFGKNRFIPEPGFEVFEKDAEIAKKDADFSTKYSNLYMKYVRNDTSFCIISYPCPEIGPNFEEIFKETIVINTLDNAKYVKIHQTIIDVLDRAKTVHVTGRGTNETNLTIALTEFNDPTKETIFENCCADVNVPVGEVFTSPKLTGTNGVLHVSEIYLDSWKFQNLKINIKDGYITECSCTNYPTKKENDDYINEHLLFDHDTLPMGEFAIGTNTYAYVMGNKYNINDKLDILIAEKTGPHFAFGDTCFSMEEENETFNPNGKKIVCKENEASIKRKSDNEQEREKAYFGCHTDVTIPYYELGDIVAIDENGNKVAIIEDGRFVLSGTEELNIDGM